MDEEKLKDCFNKTGGYLEHVVGDEVVVLLAWCENCQTKILKGEHLFVVFMPSRLILTTNIWMCTNCFCDTVKTETGVDTWRKLG